MPYLFFLRMGGVGALSAWLASLAWAQPIPGEDPLVIQSPLQYQQFPGYGGAASGGLDPSSDLPAWMRARVSRFEAQAYGIHSSVYTDNDVVTTAATQGLRKVCVQEVASNTTASGSMVTPANGRDQIVVLRGDLVNVCR
ncbi:hypothetical protein D8I35_07860 [Corticibacter populi]|uniref:DUF4148 domain-containing protein n=2 Tax=Corticibacter populi TaxID=1550736 RepID=A0A3M6QTT2_9BURK|nr:hypothetical protein D8I35_07860 [Corticibacter populi]